MSDKCCDDIVRLDAEVKSHMEVSESRNAENAILKEKLLGEIKETKADISAINVTLTKMDGKLDKSMEHSRGLEKRHETLERRHETHTAESPNVRNQVNDNTKDIGCLGEEMDKRFKALVSIIEGKNDAQNKFNLIVLWSLGGLGSILTALLIYLIFKGG